MSCETGEVFLKSAISSVKSEVRVEVEEGKVVVERWLILIAAEVPSWSALRRLIRPRGQGSKNSFS